MKTPGENAARSAAVIEAEAVAWLSERDEGFTPGRAATFEAWRRRDARHAAAIVELEQVLAQLDGLAMRREEVNAHFDRVSPAPVATPIARWWRPVAWSGVAAALAVGSFFGFRAVQPHSESETRYATSAGAYERARLEDGSTLELNAASAARVRFTAAERRVELEFGEAHFEVAHDAARPFVVSAGGVAVRAVGTAFNVRVGPGAIEVTVSEGKVTVAPALPFRTSDSQADAAGLLRDPAPARPSATLLSAHERVAIPLVSIPGASATPSPAIERLAPAEVRAALAWQRHVTDFSDTPLAEVATRFNRHNALQILVADPVLGARRIGGMFALDDVEAFVRLLERDGIVRAERDGDTLRLRAP